MKKLFVPILAPLFVASAFADFNVSQTDTVANVDGKLIFNAPNVALTITGTYSNATYSPQIKFSSDYKYAEGDKVTLTLAKGASLVSSGGLFGTSIANQTATLADIYITGEGIITTTSAEVNTYNAVSKLFLDAQVDFSNAHYKIGMAGRATSLTILNSLKVKNLDVNTDATLIQKAGSYTASGTTSVREGGTLDLSVSKGFKTSYLTVYNGSTIIIRADNAIMQDDTTYRSLSIAKDATTTLKLYADQQFDLLYFNTTGTLNAYTNGNALTFTQIKNTGTLNIFIEDGTEWVNNKIHFTNATVEKVVEILGTITIGGHTVDKSLWNIENDGNKGVYINLTAVPEPAEWAMIFGVIALGFAFIRCHKRK